MGLKWDRLYKLRTNVAGFVFYHPDRLAQRNSAPRGWWTDAAEEFASGRLVAFRTGSNGTYTLKFVQRPLTASERKALVVSQTFRYAADDGRLFWDDTSCLPSQVQAKSAEADPDGWLTLPNGRYRFTVSAIDWYSIPADERVAAGDISHYIVQVEPVASLRGVESPTAAPWLQASKTWHAKLLFERDGEPEAYTRAVAAAREARLRYYQAIGTPDAHVWVPPVDPAVVGGPVWPTRPAWQRLTNGKQTIIASSGLTDPVAGSDPPDTGFGVELTVATTDRVPADLRGSWLSELAQTVSHQAVEDGRFHIRAAKYGAFLYGVRGTSNFLDNWRDGEGLVGMLIGVPIAGVSPTIPLPAGDATLLTAKLLTPAEYDFVAERGEDGARQLVKRFAKTGSHHLSSLKRTSVV